MRNCARHFNECREPIKKKKIMLISISDGFIEMKGSYYMYIYLWRSRAESDPLELYWKNHNGFGCLAIGAFLRIKNWMSDSVLNSLCQWSLPIETLSQWQENRTSLIQCQLMLAFFCICKLLLIHLSIPSTEWYVNLDLIPSNDRPCVYGVKPLFSLNWMKFNYNKTHKLIKNP